MSTLGTVLVVGGCGLLGHHIVKKAIESEESSRVAVLDIFTHTNRIEGVDYVTGSITSRDDVEKVLRAYAPTVVFHTVSPDPLAENRERFYNVNVKGIEILLQCIMKAPSVRALIYTSSSSVVHNSYTDLVKVTEEIALFFEPDQKVYYSHTKAVAEDMILKANKQNGLLTASIRPATLFGEGDLMLWPNLTELGRKNIIIGTGDNMFDFTYVGNNAYAHVLAAKALVKTATTADQQPDHLRVDGEAFVVTNDEPWKFWDFAVALSQAAGYKVDRTKVRYLPKGPLLLALGIWEFIFRVLTLGSKQPWMNRRKVLPTTLERTFDISKAKERLGYRAQVGMQEAINRTAVWNKTRSGSQGKKEA
ncbi:putative 3-beta hydroxysteroid dehydrogenase/isomerase family protein [Amniculicola lignicola CBS 123094]|uniref:Putative 3-beta hydroxysteroid dehydrogenase/isomerase family protein n=1 Tax=Amniculicola lignicola CBS 123094 TaxID=1392246 RepID=A0A6A5W2T4_9PLEO|nr:putative 3-beta hydroxysteroid dehydrogenase/isomerase family protein [Amniculicola lignicola CBS 123094]